MRRDLPERFYGWKNVHPRHSRWSISGVWEIVLKCLATDADSEYAMIAGTNGCAHQHSAGANKAGDDQAIGWSRDRLSTKVHTLVDALGNPTGFFLTLGHVHELVGAHHLLPRMAADILIADKAFDADERVIEALDAEGTTTVSPPKASCKVARDYDPNLHTVRHLIKNFFAKLKQFRAIATRYDKTCRNFLGGIHLSAALG